MRAPRTYRLLLCLLTAAGAALASPVSAGAAGGFTTHNYANAKGSLTYKLYVPPRGGTRPTALVVVLPGAGETADVAATRSGWNAVAQRHRFVVAYPEQNPEYSSNLSWNWAQTSTEGRTNREASLVAGITRTVVAQQHLDGRRVFVMGMSAGAGMATAMAVLFPDLYSGVGTEAGCPFDATRCNGSSLTTAESAAATLAAMGRYRRAMPVFNEYGDVDPVAIGVGSDQVVPSWLIVDDVLDDGRDNGSVSRSPAARRTDLPAPPYKPYQVSTYRDRRGCALAEDWVVVGEQHAWAGGTPSEPYDTGADPLAPDVSTAMYRFFTSPTTLGGSARCR